MGTATGVEGTGVNTECIGGYICPWLFIVRGGHQACGIVSLCLNIDFGVAYSGNCESLGTRLVIVL